MQETRQHILKILRARKQATVDEIVDELRRRRGAITAVTVRHHLARLQTDGLISEPELLHRSTPGRPQHIYGLTSKALEYFPNDYPYLLTGLLEQVSQRLPSQGVNVILEGVADQMVAEAKLPDLPPHERLDIVVDFLNGHGYNAYWERGDDGFVLHTSNCPYHHVAASNRALCEMDMHLVSSLLGVVPRLLTRVSEGGATCSYLVPFKSC